MLKHLAATALTLAFAGVAQAQELNPDGSAAYNPYADFVISDDLSELPEPVRDLREKLLAAAKSGDIEALRPIIEAQDIPPHVSFGEATDAVDYLKANSEDEDGTQILATLVELLEAPYAVIGLSSDDRSYVWPYLFAVPDLRQLTAEQKVDLYQLVSADEFKDMLEFGGWYSWRVFVGADGEWQAFVAGD